MWKKGRDNKFFDRCICKDRRLWNDIVFKDIYMCG